MRKFRHLKIDFISGDAPVSLGFEAISNKTYTVQYTDRLGNAGWRKLADVPARQANHTERILDPGAKTNRFYRLLTPRQP